MGGGRGVVAFAGHPLIVEDRLVGVIAMFSRSVLSANTLDVLGAVAEAIAHGIDRKRAEDALRSTQMALARAARFTTMAALSASIAHEVTQPLSAIITNGDACLRLLAPDEPDLEETRVALAIVRPMTLQTVKAGALEFRTRAGLLGTTEATVKEHGA